MKIQTAIRELMKTKQVSLSSLGRKLGLTQQSITDRLNEKKNVTVANSLEMLNQLDYRMVLMPYGKRLPDDAIEITAE